VLAIFVLCLVAAIDSVVNTSKDTETESRSGGIREDWRRNMGDRERPIDSDYYVSDIILSVLSGFILFFAWIPIRPCSKSLHTDGKWHSEAQNRHAVGDKEQLDVISRQSDRNNEGIPRNLSGVQMIHVESRISEHNEMNADFKEADLKA